jgi:capsular exopolysaccharide synthesis family protein
MDKKLRDDRISQLEAAEPFAPGDQIDVRELFRMLWRRKFVVIGTVAVMMPALMVFLAYAVPLFTAKLSILFESRAGPIFDVKAALKDQPQDEAAILSEIEVFKSRRLAERVIDKLQLDQDAEFNPILRPKGWLARFGGEAIPDFLRPPAPPSAVASDVNEKRQQKDAIIDQFLDRLTARQIPNTRTINFSFTSNRPDLAANVLNTMAELYLVARLEDRLDNAKRASEWLSARVHTLRQRVEQSEREVEEYRRHHNLFEGERTSLVGQQISDLSTKLTDAQIESTTAEANLAQVRRLSQSSTQIETTTQVLSSELIRRFREEELNLERREADSSEKYGAQHPVMIQLQAEKRRLKDKVREEIRRITIGLENEVKVARSREAALNRDLQALKSQLAQSNQASVGLHSLERQAEASRLLLEKFLSSFMEASAQESIDSEVPDARIISPAPIPNEPSYPRYVLFMAAGLLASTVFGVALVMTIEYLDAGFRSAEQVERETGVPVLAHVPLVSNHLRGHPFPEYVLDQPHSAFAESIRSIYTHLMLSERDDAPRVVLFTSAQAEEGKSVLAWALAWQMANSGQRVVLLDTDCHRSTVANVAGIEHAPGFSDILEGKYTLEAAMHNVPGSSLRVIVAGQLPRKSEWLDRARLAAIIDGLRAENDLVVIDSSPILAVISPSVLAALSDTVVLIVRWGVTRRRVVGYALHQLGKVGVHVRGIVLSMVDVRKNAQYDYGDSGCYYGKAERYYRNDVIKRVRDWR